MAPQHPSLPTGSYCRFSEYLKNATKADALPKSPFFAYSQFPCACPASIARSGNFSIGNTTYTGLALNLPCGGIHRGGCTVDGFTNTGFCSCVSAFLPAYNSTGPIWGGNACTCRIPVVPAFSYSLQAPNVQAVACNARGTCCPSPDCAVQFDGCQCQNSWAGPFLLAQRTRH